MPYLNYAKRELNFKVVYYGPGMSGKTTNLRIVHRKLHEHTRGKMISLDTAEERTLYFDFLPLDLGEVSGLSVRFNVYTVPGQVKYGATRRLILDGADGVVFVADSQTEMLERNLVSFEDLLSNLQAFGRSSTDTPIVMQYNKRDSRDCIEPGVIEAEMQVEPRGPAVEAVAVEGIGVMETMRQISAAVVNDFEL